MKMIDLISKKKCGEAHTKEEIDFIIEEIKNDTIPDYQLSAWLMSVCFNGMTFDEASFLTEAIANSGDVMNLSSLGEYIVDKHSTGGVGDKTTLIIAPLLAAAGMPVAKLSGKGLGYTGGTIDKLESIPGFRTTLSLDEFLAQVKRIGVAIASQTLSLAPADGKIYSLRDVTATVDSIPLIASSVVSKKIASGANIIILDVKCGRGAFMKTIEEAENLSNVMVQIGKRLNRSISAVITTMEHPLGNAIGNSLEVIESINTLKNQGPEDLTEICLYLAGLALVKANKAKNIDEAKQILRTHLEDGSAFEKFKDIVKAQGGCVESIENTDKLPKANHIVDYKATSNGYLKEIDALFVAKACKLLGAGRENKNDKIDYSVGIVLTKKIGDKVEIGETLAKIHTNSLDLINESNNYLDKAFNYSEAQPKISDLILKIIE